MISDSTFTELGLINLLIKETTDLDWLVQMGVIVLALLVAWLLVRQLVSRMAEETRDSWHAREWTRFLTPLIAQVIVLAARPILSHWHSVHLLSLAQPLLLSMFLIQVTFFILRSIFQPGPGLRSGERIVSWLVWILVALHITGHREALVSALDAVGFDLGKQHISLYTAFVGLVSIAITIIVALSIGRLIEERLGRAASLKPNIKVVLTKLAKSLLLIIAVLVTLPMVGIDITVLSVFGGALGVGLGFGLQKIASNYISGFTLLLDDSIRIGDMVTVDGRFGEVREIATRYTVIRSQDGTEYILPNETLITSPVVNHTLANTENRIGIPVQVAYGSDLDQVRSIMLAASVHPRVLEDPPPRVLLMGFGDNGLNMEMRIWIRDPDEGTGPLLSDINWAIWEGFQQEGIEIPFPQRVVHMAKSDA